MNTQTKLKIKTMLLTISAIATLTLASGCSKKTFVQQAPGVITEPRPYCERAIVADNSLTAQTSFPRCPEEERELSSGNYRVKAMACLKSGIHKVDSTLHFKYDKTFEQKTIDANNCEVHLRGTYESGMGKIISTTRQQLVSSQLGCEDSAPYKATELPATETMEFSYKGNGDLVLQTQDEVETCLITLEWDY